MTQTHDAAIRTADSTFARNLRSARFAQAAADRAASLSTYQSNLDADLALREALPASTYFHHIGAYVYTFEYSRLTLDTAALDAAMAQFAIAAAAAIAAATPPAASSTPEPTPPPAVQAAPPAPPDSLTAAEIGGLMQTAGGKIIAVLPDGRNVFMLETIAGKIVYTGKRFTTGVYGFRTVHLNETYDLHAVYPNTYGTSVIIDNFADDRERIKAQNKQLLLEFAVSMVPGANTADQLQQGNYEEAAWSALGDGLTVAGPVANALKAGCRAKTIIAAANMAYDTAEMVVSAKDAVKEAMKPNADWAAVASLSGAALLQAISLGASKGKIFHCFPAGTLVSTTKGLKPIEQIGLDDRVWSFDLEHNRWIDCGVSATFNRVFHEGIVTIDVGDEQIRATAGHPFWVIEGDDLASRPISRELAEEVEISSIPGRWVPAWHLKSGDRVFRHGGKPLAVLGVTLDESPCEVYNFEVVGLHNYAVGPASFLVHNTGCDDVEWVTEAVSARQTASLYDAGADGARSAIAQQSRVVPAITRQLPDGTSRLVKFDGIREADNVLIDRKTAVTTFSKSLDQAKRQSAASKLHGINGVWQVPNQAEADRALKVFSRLGIDNIAVEIVPLPAA